MFRYTLITEDDKIFESDSQDVIYQLFAEYCAEAGCNKAIVMDNKKGKRWDVLCEPI